MAAEAGTMNKRYPLGFATLMLLAAIAAAAADDAQ
jgi:hypothetical protein